MEHAETCRILDGPTGATPNSSDINVSFFSQTPKDMANSGMMYDVDENSIDEATIKEIQQECNKHMNTDTAIGRPAELNHENMSFYNSIFDQHSSRASFSSPSSRAQNSPGTASTSTVETEVARRPQAGSTGARKKVKGVSDEEAALLARDDTELSEKELQLKRKAQNRLAQRAFRERKETRMKELELKLTQSEDEKKRLLDQLDLIRKHHLSMQSENERLRSLASSSSTAEPAEPAESRSLGSFSFAFPSTQEDFVHNLVGDAHEIDTNNLNTVYENPQEPGEKILAVGAVWDYLVRMAEESDKDIDVLEIMEKLKGNERCHGYGPAYPLKLVQEVAERYSFSQ
ncbi:Fluconazole resistance protein 3 [Meyerozyma sp. JA9]|nr:Fluconazole resistance protein 3 [Meyerozyma sp. JA9]